LCCDNAVIVESQPRRLKRHFSYIKLKDQYEKYFPHNTAGTVFWLYHHLYCNWNTESRGKISEFVPVSAVSGLLNSISGSM